MSLLGELANSLTGGLKLLLVPGLIVGGITAVHQMTQARAAAKAAQEAALVLRGRQQCLAEVQLAQTQAELEVERKRTAQAREEAASAQSMAREVGEKVNELEAQLQVAQASAPGSNPGCLSDGMRQRLWGNSGGPAVDAAGGSAGGGHQ